MPTFKQFGGYRVEIRSRDHNPPHFHVINADFHALIRIADLQIARGTIDRRAYAEVLTWAAGNIEALMAEWRRLNERD